MKIFTNNLQLIFKLSNKCFWAQTMSLIERSGKDMPYGSPVNGFIDVGPVDPWQAPRQFEQITK